MKIANKLRLFQVANKYPFMVWVPADKSPDAGKYDRAVKATGKPIAFTRISMDKYRHVWCFADLSGLMRFCEDLRNMLSGVDRGKPVE